jgi:hypothetical protein
MCALLALTLLAGCANGDFGEIKPYLVNDTVHDWLGRDGGKKPLPPSVFEFTEDERALRDNAYPLIEPPYDRQQWYSIAGEYGIPHSSPANYPKYFERLINDPHRTAASRYQQVIEDIRNDNTRLAQFFETAGRVIDIDQKRMKSLNYVSNLVPSEKQNALRRVRENQHVVDIVYQSLGDRVAAYHFALERLVVVVPSPQAVEVERQLTVLESQIARYRTLPPTWQREPSLASSN